MNRTTTRRKLWASGLACALLAIGCGGATQGDAARSPTSPATDAGTNSVAANSAQPSASPAAAPTPSAAPSAPPVVHPVAATAGEASRLIDAAINAQATQLVECVDAARIRRNDPHAKLVIEIAINGDEGHAVGAVLPKGQKPDSAFVDCVLRAVHEAPFPKSKGGILRVLRTFEDRAVSR